MTSLSLALASLSLVLGAGPLAAAAITVTRQQNSIEQSQTASAFFLQSPDNLITLATQVGFSGTIGAGDGASTTSSGSLSVVGNSTSAGGWIDGNGVPAGITLGFNVQFTVSTPTANSFLTTAGNSGTALGNGIGITQTAGTTGNTGVGEILELSALTLSGIGFSGALMESGFRFTPGTVGNGQWNRLRSNNFAEATAGVTATVSGGTWGFGTATGTLGSNLAIENNYTTVGFLAAGPVTFSTEAGSWNLKGLAFQYDVSYDVVAVPEPTAAALMALGGLLGLTTARRRYWKP